VPLYSLLGDARDLIAWMAIGFQVLLIVAVLLVIVAVLAGRQQSIGVLRALGAPRSFIFLTVWLQAVLMIASGVVAGALLGWALGRGFGALVSERIGLAVRPEPGQPEILLMLSLLVAGSLLATLPSLVALRASTHRLLRLA